MFVFRPRPHRIVPQVQVVFTVSVSGVVYQKSGFGKEHG